LHRIIAKKLKLPWKEIDRFASLQKQLNYTLEEMETSADKLLPNELYTRNDILQEFNIKEDELIEQLLTPNTKDMKVFKLRQRALHVFQGELISCLYETQINFFFYSRGYTSATVSY
jgi:hypothetical protein